MPYSSDMSPQQKAAQVSGENRAQRAQERREREARHAHYAKGGVPGHAFICICDECEAVRDQPDDHAGLVSSLKGHLPERGGQ